MECSCNSIEIEEIDGEHPLLLFVSGTGPESTGHDDGRAEGRAADEAGNTLTLCFLPFHHAEQRE